MLEHLYEKHGKKKIYIVLALVLIVLNFIIINITYQVKTRFSIKGEKFKYVSSTQNEILFKDSGDNKVIVTIDNSLMASVPFQFGTKARIEYKDKIIIFDSSDWQKTGEVITLSDGSTFKRGIITVVVDNDYRTKPQLPDDVQLVDNIRDVYGFVKEYNIFWFVLLTIPLILLGLVSLIYPEEVWRFQHMMHVNGGEPTDWAIFSNKLGGIFFIGLGLLLPVILVNY
jgi:hypothetical protein